MGQYEKSSADYYESAYPVRAITTGAPCDIKTNAGRLVKPDPNGIYWLSPQEAQAVRFMPGMKVLD